MPSFTRSETVLSGRFSFCNPSLVLARVRLYPDRLELSGWHMRGRYVRRIALQRVLQTDVLKADSLLLWLSNGETVRLRVQRAVRWKRAIEHHQRLLRNAT